MNRLDEVGARARAAARQMTRAAHDQRVDALHRLAELLDTESAKILAANDDDVAAARAEGRAESWIDRLRLDRARLAGIARDLLTVADLPDPLGQAYDQRRLPSGIAVERVRVPLGVLAVIYESRPNVTIDIAALAIKTGNVAILRGGSDTLRSNRALLAAVYQALDGAGLPRDAVQLLIDPDRSLVNDLLRLHEYVDLVIPRGGNELHRFCRENATVPVITGGIGICHLYLDASADLSASLPVIRNAKVQRPSVCNALDTLLVHERVAARALRAVVDLLAQDGVTFRAEPHATLALGALPNDLAARVAPAGPQDFDTEWLSLVLGLKVVSDLEAAIAHIEQHSTAHSDGILTEDRVLAEQFLSRVDSAAVYWNASTRFTDGAQLGLGAEVAVSTQRLHARGPMGLPEMTTYKWVIRGSYTTRA
ncbi:MAG: glutamate-5-semialdehyde dehydrogenase [Candidatus Eisenbacteria bacterium]|nr:glutamate-5-semialdehyde dehydrogenase [Candidatus Eisenbacteria bacterium]